MAKRVNSISLKGHLHEDFIIEEFGKGEEPSEYFALMQILEEFKDKHVTISIKEEQSVEQTEE
ncbi:YonK family protein [Paenibacillus sp. FSL R7-0302]|uniref:YonK family protein n=1 Tax=Paenibacillus sp. FSL R7-0302 TaxID=2921681 RepID=UPI0030FAA2E3